MDFRGQVWKRMWKTEYFGQKLGQELGIRAAHPYQEFRGVFPPGYNTTFGNRVEDTPWCSG